MNPKFNLLLIFSLFVQINSESISLKTKEEIITHSYGNYTKNILESGPTTILFNIPDFEPKNPQFEFKVNNEELSVRYSQAETLAKTPYYYYQQKGNIFEVSLIVDNDKAEPGLYDLKITEGERIEFSKSQLNSPPILPEVHKPKRVLEGDQLRLKCIAKAYPMINQYIWEFGYMDSEKGENEEFQIAAINNLTIIDDVNEDELIIKSLEKNNNGLYRCTAKNSLGNDQVTYFVNVKNRWAALWPFIGIVIEVAVLVSAILIYEHHSMKNKSRTPNNTTQSNNNVNPINNLESVPEFRESIRERNTPKI